MPTATMAAAESFEKVYVEMYRAVRSLAGGMPVTATAAATAAATATVTAGGGEAEVQGEAERSPRPGENAGSGVAVAMRKALAAVAEATALSASNKLLSDLSQAREPPAQDQALAEMRLRALDLMFGGEG